MGAFVLFEKKRKKELDIDGIQSTFTNKGFSPPLRFVLGENELYLYKKQLVDVENYCSEAGDYIFVIGTLV